MTPRALADPRPGRRRRPAGALGLLAAAALSLVAGCGQPAPPPATTPTPAPATPAPTPTPTPTPVPEADLGRHSRKVTTDVPEAQHRFDRGLTLAYSFNHRAAEKEFRKAAEADAKLAMAWWGVSLVNGPHINNPEMSPEQSKAAWEALVKARELEGSASDVEKALIAALGKRYVEAPPEDRKPLDQAYAKAMTDLWKQHPDDADIGALYAESMMDLRPWAMFRPGGIPEPGTPEVEKALEQVLAKWPDHPLANHLYIHLMEGSKEPKKAEAAADRLRDLVPGAGHMVHMPAHIYIRTARWEDAATANLKAIEADRLFRLANPGDPGFYNIYMAHNHQFLSFAQMMQGRSADAIQAARDMVAGIPPAFMKEAAFFVDGVSTLPYAALLRFGKWEEMLKEPEPPEYHPVARAMRRFSRAAALNALGRSGEAAKERDAFRAAAAAVSKDAIVANNKAADILAIAGHVIDGEIAANAKKFPEAIRSLSAAARIEDTLRYDEPPDWTQPVRHTLGAVLLRAGKAKEAEKAYREDLTRFPENGWSLLGLSQSLRMQKKTAAADEADARFRKAWARADTPVPAATCLCQPAP